MVIQKKYQQSILIVVTLITVLVFFAGLFLGYSLDKLKADKVLDIVQENEISYESYVAEEQFFDAFGGTDCNLLSARTTDLSKEIGELGRILDVADNAAVFNEKQLDLFKRRYFILEVLFLTKNYELSKTCNTNYHVILFFYKKDHQESSNQGYILDALNEKYNKELTVLSFDYDYDEPLINMLKDKYMLYDNDVPAVVVNNIVRRGVTSEEELQSILKGTYHSS